MRQCNRCERERLGERYGNKFHTDPADDDPDGPGRNGPSEGSDERQAALLIGSERQECEDEHQPQQTHSPLVRRDVGQLIDVSGELGIHTGSEVLCLHLRQANGGVRANDAERTIPTTEDCER